MNVLWKKFTKDVIRFVSQIGPKAGVGREEKEPPEGKNHGQAVGGTGDGIYTGTCQSWWKRVVGGKRIFLWKTPA